MSAKPSSPRHRSREAALQALYAADIAREPDLARAQASLDALAEHFELPAGAKAFAKELVLGVATNREEIDRLERDGYLARWLQSGRPLRYWLIVGFKHFLLEESRRRKRSKSSPLPSDTAGTHADGQVADQAGGHARSSPLGRVGANRVPKLSA